MFRRLSEAINIPGAIFIGTAKGYDFFDIQTYAAAQEFKIKNSNTPAGQTYVHDEATFNANINENTHLYFFVEQNTNKVFGGVVKGPQTTSTLQIAGETESFDLGVNFLFETSGNDRNLSRLFPFFLIPNIAISNADVIDGMLVRNNRLVAVLSPLIATDTISINLDNFPEITSIAQHAFRYYQDITEIVLGSNITNMSADILDTDNIHKIIITWSEKPAGWSDDWDARIQHKVEYTDARVSDAAQQRAQEAEEARQREAEETRQRAEREAEETRQRAEREAEEARQRAEREAEEARQRAEREAEEARRREELKMLDVIADLRYEQVKNEITILGVKPSFTGRELIIPKTIGGLPVTRIAPLAFYKLKHRINSINILAQLKEIGAGAFASVVSSRIVLVLPKNCVLGKNVFYDSNISYTRQKEI